MTVIVALQDSNMNTYVAADRRLSTDDGDYSDIAMYKMKQFTSDIVMAGCGDISLISLILCDFKFPKRNKKDSLDTYVYTSINRAIQKRLSKLINKKKNYGILADCEILLVIDKAAYVFSLILDKQPDVHLNLSVEKTSFPVTMGMGGPYAKGAIDALLPLTDEFEFDSIARKAIKIASDNNASCSPSFDIILLR